MASKKKLSSVKIIKQPGSDAFYAQWSSITEKSWYSNCDYIQVVWYYRVTTDGKWYQDGDAQKVTKSRTNTSNNLYTPSNSNAIEIRVRTKPVPKNKKFTSEYVYATRAMQEGPDAPSTPNITLDNINRKITMELTNIVVDGLTDARKPTHAKFYYGDMESESMNESEWLLIVNRRVSYTTDMLSGVTYSVYAQFHNSNGIPSEYSDIAYSETTEIPDNPSFFEAVPDSNTAGRIRLTWGVSEGAQSYTIEYCPGSKRFESDEKQSISVEASSSGTSQTYYLTLSLGTTYYFRIQAVNGEMKSDWVEAGEGSTIGRKPEPPTCWTIGTSFSVGDTARLYFVHNSADGSTIRNAECRYSINGGSYQYLPSKSYDEEEDPEIRYFDLSITGSISDSDTVSWQVRTKGVYDEYSDWSSPTEFTVYQAPTLYLSVDSLISSYPFSIGWDASPSTQTPVSISIEILNDSPYLITDMYGFDKYVNANTILYSKVLVAPGLHGSVSLIPNDIQLLSGESYTVNAVIEMDSALRAEATVHFSVELEELDYTCDAEIRFFEKDYTAIIAPNARFEEYVEGESSLVPNVNLTVYRVNADGSFTKIAEEVPNNGGYYVTDPHPTMKTVAYRIVAIEGLTGSISYADITDESFKNTSIIIGWDEQYSTFFGGEEFDSNDNNHLGTMLKLPYNVKVSESNSMDVSLQQYIGRDNPVSYYGTQKGYAANWTCEIPKDDTETLYMLRRLAMWPGDVYVREPSGTGYWAQVSVSFNVDYNSVIIPITLAIKRVDGGGQ